MINTRILELVKNPYNIQPTDLGVLEREISKYPYVQSFRALYLLGIRMFDEDNYQYELSKTAAYTTDKKILRSFVNPENKEEFNTENQQNEKEIEVSESVNEIENVEEQLGIQNTENQQNEKRIEVSENVNEIENVEEQLGIQNTENQKIEDDYSDELSFHSTETFLPSLNISSKNQEKYIPPKSEKISKHEEEMQRLIAEVEAKMKAKKSQQIEENKKKLKIVEDYTTNAEISFSETQDFNFSEDKKEEKIEEKNIILEKQTENKEWKPMNLVQELPDSEIGKENKKTDNQDFKQDFQSEKEEERPVLDVSFFSENVSENKDLKKVDSNVSEFIMTWQKWLNPEPSTEEIKEKAIETFIENEPKISKRKEEVSFVMKEKDDDISHLMTETLVKLYLDQRLYTKAIEGYKILQEKYPEKYTEFEQKIEEIKQIKIGKP